jgi:hypothetical protein
MRTFLVYLVFLAACGGGSHGTLDASTGDGGGSGALCGGFGGKQCAATEYCDYSQNTCGTADEAGTCRPRPDVCPASAAPDLVATPTCACNGMVYANDCEAARAGADVSGRGGCTVPAGKFACGYTQCTTATQYCRRQLHTGGTDTFSCAALPSCPVLPSCTCLSGEPCGNSCDGDASTGLTLSCAAI